MDLDHFKEINDNHGHHVGDRALREVAGVLRAAIRPYDICVRYAGDEFIVVLSGCGADEAERKRVELQTAIDEVVFEARPGKRLQLGISIGAAIFPHDGNTYETLLATADSRMYRDKTKRKRCWSPSRAPSRSRRAASRRPRSASPSSSARRRACCNHSRLDPVRAPSADSRQQERDAGRAENRVRVHRWPASPTGRSCTSSHSGRARSARDRARSPPASSGQTATAIRARVSDTWQSLSSSSKSMNSRHQIKILVSRSPTTADPNF